MEPPAIALRFRDTTPGVDTIDAHKALLRREGAVWWGWWKKDFEDVDVDSLTQSYGQPRQTLIVNRQTRRMFLAECRRWQPGGGTL